MCDAWQQSMVLNPYFFSLICANRLFYNCTVWIAFDGNWWAAPPSQPGYSLFLVPILEGLSSGLEIVSETMLDAYIACHSGSFDNQLSQRVTLCHMAGSLLLQSFPNGLRHEERVQLISYCASESRNAAAGWSQETTYSLTYLLSRCWEVHQTMPECISDSCM